MAGWGRNRRNARPSGAGAPHSAREFSPRLGGGAARAGHERRFRHRFFYFALGGEMRPQGAACCFGAFATRECTCRVQRAASVSGMPLRGARRLTYFLAALSAVHHLDIPCPCGAREHPLGRGGKTKSDKNRHFPLSQSGFPSRSFSPQPSPPLPFFLVVA